MKTSKENGAGRTNKGQTPRRLVVLLIHPTNYDHRKNQGIGAFAQTYRLGVIPSNTLRVMESLTREAFREGPFTAIETEVHSFEDSIRGQQKAFRRMLERFPEQGTRLVVGFVAVQSNQFPRACDLMREAKAHGATCVIGGPHITATINASLHGISTIDPMRPGVVSPHRMPVEIQELIDEPGVVVFHGDADNEGAWSKVLKDVLAGSAKDFYEGGLAGQLEGPGGVYTTAQLDDFVSPVAAVDTERGCPFKCKFCAAIQAHGRSVRCREPRGIVDWVRRQCEAYRKPVTVLFASDNLARNPHWRELLTGLQELRAKGHDFTIWAEADVRCNSGPNAGFLEEYAKAGGQGLFFGIESMNPANIQSAGKKQNDVEELPAFFAECRRHGIAPEGGYIIGFAEDTPESVVADVNKLIDAGLARAWFFIKTLLPGSQDWVEAIVAGVPISQDYNDYDSTKVMCPHESMSADEWTAAYEAAIRTFYSARGMITNLSRYPDPTSRWRLIKGFLWCRWAYLTEQSHPMIAGLYRHRSFGERRPGQKRLSYPAYLLAEAWRHMRYFGLFLREFYVFQNVILEVEWRQRSGEGRARLEAELRGVRDWFYRAFRAPMRRAWLNGFWKRYGGQKWKLLNPLNAGWHLNMLPYALAEVIYTARFVPLFIRGLRTEG